MADAGFGVCEASWTPAAGDDYFSWSTAALPGPVLGLAARDPRGPSRMLDPLVRLDRPRLRLPAIRDAVIYELHVGTFSPRARSTGPSAARDLAGLGVTTLELMPVAEFPGAPGLGVRRRLPVRHQSSYGGPHGLQRLVDAAHARGPAVSSTSSTTTSAPPARRR